MSEAVLVSMRIPIELRDRVLRVYHQLRLNGENSVTVAAVYATAMEHGLERVERMAAKDPPKFKPARSLESSASV